MADERRTDDFTHDTGFKDLVQDFPEWSIRWLTPDTEKVYGPIEEVTFLREEMKHHWLSDAGRVLDIPMMVEFQSGKALITLIEHKGDKPSFSLYKLAHYTLDLAEDYPNIPIIPIAVFGDPVKWRKDVARELKIEVLGHVWLYFTYHKVKLKDLKAADYLNSENPVLHILSPLMDYPAENRFQVAADAHINLKRLGDTAQLRKYMDFIDKYAKIKPAEKAELLNLLTHREEGIMLREAILEEGIEQGIERGIERGIEQGIERGVEKVLRDFLESGLDPKFAAKATGLPLAKVLEIKNR